MTLAHDGSGQGAALVAATANHQHHHDINDQHVSTDINSV